MLSGHKGLLKVDGQSSKRSKMCKNRSTMGNKRSKMCKLRLKTCKKRSKMGNEVRDVQKEVNDG